MFRSDVVFQLDHSGVQPMLKPPWSVRLALLDMIMILTRSHVEDWDRPASLTTTHPEKRRRQQESSWPSKRLVSMPHLIFLFSSHTVRLQTTPQPDLLHERSYRTCFEPDNPLRRTASPVPAHPHHHGCQEGIINPATSTFRLVVVGRPCCRRGPWWPSCPPTGGGPACVVARNSDVNVIRAPRGPAPHGGCPSSASRCALGYTVSTPVLRLMRRRPVRIRGT